LLDKSGGGRTFIPIVNAVFFVTGHPKGLALGFQMLSPSSSPKFIKVGD